MTTKQALRLLGKYKEAKTAWVGFRNDSSFKSHLKGHSVKNGIWGCFNFSQTEKGHRYWEKIARKVDKLKKIEI